MGSACGIRIGRLQCRLQWKLARFGGVWRELARLLLDQLAEIGEAGAEAAWLDHEPPATPPSLARRILSALISRRWFEVSEADSRKWIVRYSHRRFSQSVWDTGGYPVRGWQVSLALSSNARCAAIAHGMGLRAIGGRLD